MNTLLGELNSIAMEANLIHTKFKWLDKYLYKVRKLKHFLHLVVQFGSEVQRAKEENSSSDGINNLCELSKKFISFLCESLKGIFL